MLTQTAKGGLTGYTSLFNTVPSLNFGFVVLGNSITATVVAEILFHHLLNERLHLSEEKRFDFVGQYAIHCPLLLGTDSFIVIGT